MIGYQKRRKPTLIGSSECIKEVKRKIEEASSSDMPVLIRGETGVGKEITAKLIHLASGRKRGPFVVVSCPGLLPSLARSELFGHERGAYTGADKRRIGKFEEAEGGTIFLDEIADLNPEVQAMVLRAVEKGEIERLGGKERIKVNVRVIAATNKDIEKLTEDDYFRKDLYYRLIGHVIHIPPLRKRKEDIPELIDHFISLYSLGKPPVISKEVLNELLSYDWPGNVRELEMMIRRICEVHGGRRVGIEELRDMGLWREEGLRVKMPSQFNLKEEVKRLKRKLIMLALSETRGNISKAAEMLGISRQGLSKMMKNLGIKKGGNDVDGGGNVVTI
ncbi:TPA: sigma-54-dependent Fis family transcriptional regulator [Candidatus Poribacteria bacterium]|nr:sigma-54-dependent Fis family transcriptional regulator [Candidatus Poribacteria bacterium]